MAHKVFICHSAKDKHVADAACAALEAHRISCWIAPRDILAGEEYGASLIEALDECQIVLLIFSLNANNSPQVRREIERAVSKEKIVVPFRIEDVLPTHAMEFALMNTHWLDALTPPMEHRLTELCETISRLIQKHPITEPLWQPPAGDPTREVSPAIPSASITPLAAGTLPYLPAKLEGSFKFFGRGNGAFLFRVVCVNVVVAAILLNLRAYTSIHPDFLSGFGLGWFPFSVYVFVVAAMTGLRVYVPRTMSFISSVRLWRALRKVKLGKHAPADVFWSEEGGKSSISFVVANESWETPETVKKYQDYASAAAGIIGSNPLTCHLLDKNLVIRLTFTVSLQDGNWAPDAPLVAPSR